MKWNDYTFNELDLELVFLIRDELKLKLGEDADDALMTSSFLNRLQEDPIYVHHFDEDYWVEHKLARRMNPQERIDELGDASVPFKFDVHAMIFSDDAVGLEYQLH